MRSSSLPEISVLRMLVISQTTRGSFPKSPLAISAAILKLLQSVSTARVFFPKMLCSIPDARLIATFVIAPSLIAIGCIEQGLHSTTLRRYSGGVSTHPLSGSTSGLVFRWPRAWLVNKPPITLETRSVSTTTRTALCIPICLSPPRFADYHPEHVGSCCAALWMKSRLTWLRTVEFIDNEDTNR
jgi:hypothetical protein